MKKFISTKLEDFFWFFILLSWIPLLGSYSFFPSSQIIDESNKLTPTLMPEATFLAHPYITVLTLLFILCIPISFVLRKRYISTALEKQVILLNGNQPSSEKIKEIKRDSPWYLLASLPLLLSITIPFFANDSSVSKLAIMVQSVYLGAIIISIFLYLRHAHLISASFVIFSLLLIFDSTSLYISNLIQHGGTDENVILRHYSFFGAFFESYSMDFIKVLMFVLSAVLIRLIYLMVRDNFVYLRDRNQKDIMHHSKQTFKLWWPMLFIFVFFSITYHFYYAKILEPKMVAHIVGCANDEPTAEQIIQDDGFTPVCPKDTFSNEKTPHTLESAIQQTNERKLELLNQKSIAVLNATKNKAVTDANKAPDEVYNDLNNSLPKRLPGTKTRSCGLNIICLVKNGLKSASNSAYVSVKNSQLRKLRHKLNEIKKVTNDTAGVKEAQMKDLIVARLAQFEDINRIAVESSFKGFKWLSWLVLIYSIMILLKTFLIVYSRVSFSNDTDDTASFKTENDIDVVGVIKKVSHLFTLPKTDSRTYYFSRSEVNIEGPPQDRYTPIRFMAFFKRLFNGRLTMNRVIPAKYNKTVKVSVKAPSEMARWDLKKHEKVYFDFADFIGMCDAIKIKRHVSFSVSTLIFGNSIHYYAEGPGRLYLRTLSKPSVIRQTTNPTSHSTSKLVAWNVSTSYNVVATRNIVNTFLSDANIEPEKTNKTRLVLFDTDAKRGETKSAGILRFAKSFLLPV